MALFLREIHAGAESPDGTRNEKAVAALVSLERSYGYLIDNVWDVYNSLEKDVLFPWVNGGVPDNHALARALTLFGKERDRIEDSADVLQTKFSRLVCSTGYPHSSMGPCSRSRRLCATRARRVKRRREAQDAKARAAALKESSDGSRELSRRKKASLQLREGYQPVEEEGKKVVAAKPFRGVNPDEIMNIAGDLANVIEDTERLHKTERGLLYPLIANTFPEKEQARLTNVLVYSMRSAMAKFIITVYHQAVEKQAARAQWKYYKREVPLPVRVYTHVWTKRLYDGSPLGWLRTSKVKDLVR